MHRLGGRRDTLAMSEIAIAVINAILPVILSILGVSNATKAQTQLIQAITQAIQQQQTVENTNILGLQNQLNAIAGQLTTLQATVGTGNLQELNVLQNINTKVQQIPTNSGGTMPDVIAEAVWTYAVPTTEREAQQLLSAAGFYAEITGTSYIRKPTAQSVYIDIVAEWQYVLGDQDGFDGPGTDSTDILPTDTLLTWLNRTTNINSGSNSPYSWGYGGPFQPDVAYTEWINIETQPQSWLVCNLSQQDFAKLQASVVRPTPPVWPGLANVTLSDPVAIVPPSQTIDVPCDGVLVALTAWPTQKPVYDYDSQQAIGFLGGVTFVTDNGYAEPEQRLGFETALYVPLEMTRATQVVVRSNLAVTGTITPWSLNG